MIRRVAGAVRGRSHDGGMPKTVSCASLGTGVLITFDLHGTESHAPRSEHAVVLVGWEQLERLQDAIAPRNARRPGERPEGRHVDVVAAVAKTWWEWPIDSDRPPRDDGFEPCATSFRTDDLFVVNGPLPGRQAPEVTLVLNGPRAGDGLYLVLSEAEVEDLTGRLSELWLGHLDELGAEG